MSGSGIDFTLLAGVAFGLLALILSAGDLVWRMRVRRVMRLAARPTPDPALWVKRDTLRLACTPMIDASICTAESKLDAINEWRSFITFLAYNMSRERQDIKLLLYHIWQISDVKPYYHRSKAEQLSWYVRTSLLSQNPPVMVDCYPIEIIAALNAVLEPYERNRHNLYYKS